MAIITIDFAGRTIDFELDDDTKRWRLSDPQPAPFDEGDYPLIGTLDGKRYELYSDSTYAEVELP